MPQQPSRRDLLGPPPADVTDLAKVARRHGWNLRSLDPGLQGGEFAAPRPVGPGPSELVGEESGSDGDADPQWEDGDRLVVTATGQQVWRLSHEPIEESLFVRWHPRGLTHAGVPWPNEHWSLDEQTVIIPDSTNLLEAGDAFSCQYQYLDTLTEPAAFLWATSVAGDHTEIPMVGATEAGDWLVLVMSARVTAAPTDDRFTAPGFTDTMGGFGAAGVWIGTADGSGRPVSITMTSGGVGDPADGAAALMAISGDSLSLLGDATSLTSPSGTSPFTPTRPSTAGVVGIAALFAVSGIASGSISEQTSFWDLRSVQQGGGAGKCSVYLGTAEGGVPAGGTWQTNGSTIIGGARIMGV
jgi:hypothetical protein